MNEYRSYSGWEWIRTMGLHKPPEALSDFVYEAKGLSITTPHHLCATKQEAISKAKRILEDQRDNALTNLGRFARGEFHPEIAREGVPECRREVEIATRALQLCNEA